MRKRYGLLLVVVGALLFPTGAMGQQPLRWQPTLESAKRLAAQTDRLVLIHFWADWCHACQKMEREVFTDQGVASALQTHYVPVKVNADYFPATRKQYGVTALPTDVVITPQGHLVERIQTQAVASEYMARLYQVANAVKGNGRETYAQGPDRWSPAMAGRANLPRDASGDQTSGAPSHLEGRYADYYNRQRQASPAPVTGRYADRGTAGPGGPQHSQAQRPAPPAQAGPPGRPPQIQIPPGNPPLGLDGYCPVELANKSQWVLGNRFWGVRHRGRTYLFAGPEQQRRFLAQPDRFAPVLSGDDVVIAIEQGKSVPGYREHGVFFGNKVYLFANEASLERFSRNPNQYATQALQAMQVGGSPRRQFR